MKRSVSLLVILAMIVTTFAGFATLATADQFLINFDTAFDIGSISATTAPAEKAFFYSKGESKTAGGWFGGNFPEGTKMVYTVNDGTEYECGTSAAEPGVQAAVKGAVPDANLFLRFNMDCTQVLKDTYEADVAQTIKIYAKKPDASKVLLYSFKTDLRTQVSLDQTVFYEGDPIAVSYKNAHGDQNDWLCIYKDPEEGQAYGQSTYTSQQYAYIDGSGTVVFNDPEKKVAENDRTAVLTGADTGGRDIIVYNQGSISTLTPGHYHAIILGGTSWYDVKCEKVSFEVIAKEAVTAENGDYTVDLSKLAGTTQSFSPHGYPDLKSMNMGYNDTLPLGLFDLTGFESVEITYATDAGFKAKHGNMAVVSCFALMSENVSIGFADASDYQNKDKIIAKGDCVDASVTNPSGAGWAQNERTVSISIADSTYTGNLVLSHFNSIGNTALVVGIKFIAKTEAVEKSISTDKTTYVVGEPIKVTYTGADRANNDWLCIYEGAESTYGEPGGPVSIQYAYIGGNGTIVFNDINKNVAENDRTALHSSLDAAYNETDKIFYQYQSTPEELKTLSPGTYHAVLLGGDSWYNVESEKIVFTVEEDSTIKSEFGLENVEGKLGDTVEVALTFNNNPGISYFKVQVGYDAEKLELIEIKQSNPSFALTLGPLHKNPYTIQFSTSDGFNQNPPVNGEVCKLVFKILDKTSSISTSALDLIVVEVDQTIGVGDIVNITNTFTHQDGSVEIKDVDCNHSFDTIVSVDNENHKKVCSICQREYLEAHSWDDGEVTKDPTCTDAGKTTYHCNACEATKEEDIPAELGHDWGEWVVTTEPDCETKGEETRTCKTDANHKETREIAALGHDWGEWVVTTEPDCETKGEETRTCKTDANHKETREIAALGHNWGEGEVTTEPTCTEKGEKTFTCSVCEATKTEEIAALGHSFTNYVYNNDATKTKDGTETAECDHGCGAKDTRTKEGTKLPDDNPSTGDAGWWIAGIALVSIAGAAAVMYYKKKVND